MTVSEYLKNTIELSNMVSRIHIPSLEAHKAAVKQYRIASQPFTSATELNASLKNSLSSMVAARLSTDYGLTASAQVLAIKQNVKAINNSIGALSALAALRENNASLQKVKEALQPLDETFTSLRINRMLDNLKESSDRWHDFTLDQQPDEWEPSDELVNSVHVATSSISQSEETANFKAILVSEPRTNVTKAYIKEHPLETIAVLLAFLSLLVQIYFGVIQSLPNEQQERIAQAEERQAVTQEAQTELLRSSHETEQQKLQLLQNINETMLDVADSVEEVNDHIHSGNESCNPPDQTQNNK